MDNESKIHETEIIVREQICLRCQHKWIPRKPDTKPLTCPACHSAYWFRPLIRARIDTKIKVIPGEKSVIVVSDTVQLESPLEFMQVETKVVESTPDPEIKTPEVIKEKKRKRKETKLLPPSV